MADNLTLNAGSGGSDVRTDDDGTAHWQYIKVAYGPDNTQNIVGSISSNPFPVALSATDNAVLDAIAASLAGTLTVGSHAVTNVGTFVTQIDGAALTALQLIDNPVVVLGTATYTEASSSGNIMAAVRKDTLAALADTDNEFAPLQVNDLGALWIDHEPNRVDSGNSSTATLTSGSTFTGTGVDILAYAAVTIQIDASHDSATDGMSFQFSTDNSNWDSVHLFTYTAADGARVFQFDTHAQYFRFVYTNGGTGQATFRLQTILRHHTPVTSIHRLVDATSPDRSALLTKTALIAQAAGSGDFVPVQATAGGNLKIAVEEFDAALAAGTNLIGDVGISGARTSGGTTIFRSIDLDEGTLEVVKGSAGQIYWMHVMNLANAVRFVKIYNATSGTYGTGTPVLTFAIPTQGDTNGAGFTLAVPNGIAFATGISIGAGTGVADADTGAPGANEVICNLGFG